MERQYITVTALNRYLKYQFDHDDQLQKILLKAEISNFKRHSRGHLYLTLKDEQSEVSAVMFSSDASRLKFSPKDGDQVIIEGHVSIYEPRGSYQVYIKKMDIDGIGDLYLAYEALKKALADKGYFDESHKLPLPKYPKTIGVVTSPTGAAVRDIINVLSLRYPLAKIIIYPALVQGDGAKASIVSQIEAANQDMFCDLLIVGRGGGSIEDLWAFNEEVVAKAIYQSKLPIISAVGHETDFTIADFVADQRASTPSHAAEMAVPNKTDLLLLISESAGRMRQALIRRYEENKQRFSRAMAHHLLQRPEKLIESKKMKLSYLEDTLTAYKPSKQISYYQSQIQSFSQRLAQAAKNLLDARQKQFLTLTEKLDLVNPLSIMKKGYTITKQDGSIRKSIQDVDATKPLQVNFHDGTVDCSVIKKEVKQ